MPLGTDCGRGLEVHCIHESAAVVLGEEQDDVANKVEQRCGAECPGEPLLRSGIGPDTHQIDVSSAIDLNAAEHEYVEPPLRRHVERLGSAVHKRCPPGIAMNGDIESWIGLLSQQSRRCRYRGVHAGGHE
jgi:hypothetical protein